MEDEITGSEHPHDDPDEPTQLSVFDAVDPELNQAEQPVDNESAEPDVDVDVPSVVGDEGAEQDVDHDSSEQPLGDERAESDAESAPTESRAPGSLPDVYDERSERAFADIEVPEELLAYAGAPVLHPPVLERPRPERAPIVPHWIWMAVAALVLVVAAAAGGWALYQRSLQVEVPSVVGRTDDAARSELTLVGLETAVSEERFSSEPKGEVLEQSPMPGTIVREGDVVELIVSAGTEEIVMPDVIGDGLNLARGLLQDRGLTVEIEPVTSEQPSDTVLSSTPAAGALVRAGDVVRLQVATPQAGTAGLRPYRLQGVTVMIDPGAIAAGKPDVGLEVARRLRSLLEASGALVVVLRSGNDTATTDVDRAARAKESSATIAVGLTASSAGPGGRRVSTARSAVGTSTADVASTLAREMADRLKAEVPPAELAAASRDTVLGGQSSPWVRVSLGSHGQRADQTAFADPGWADKVARALYASLGEVFGFKEEL